MRLHLVYLSDTRPGSSSSACSCVRASSSSPLRELLTSLDVSRVNSRIAESSFSIVRVFFTVVPGVSFLTIARWGFRELGIFIICANSMTLRACTCLVLHGIEHWVTLQLEVNSLYSVVFRPNFWVAEKTVALLRQKARPSLYFFRSLRERASGRRRRLQGSRQTIEDSVLRWTPKSGTPKDITIPSHLEKARQGPFSHGKSDDSLLRKDPTTFPDARTTQQSNALNRQGLSFGRAWDLEQGIQTI